MWFEVSVSVSLPRFGETFVSNLHVHLVQAGRQHRKETGDHCGRPLHRETLHHVYEHNAVIVLSSEVWTLDGENSVSCTKEDLITNKASVTQAEIITTCHLINWSSWTRYYCLVNASESRWIPLILKVLRHKKTKNRLNLQVNITQLQSKTNKDDENDEGMFPYATLDSHVNTRAEIIQAGRRLHACLRRCNLKVSLLKHEHLEGGSGFRSPFLWVCFSIHNTKAI